MRQTLIHLACLGAMLTIGTVRLPAGGSGLNVALVVNETSTNSIALGNYLAEKRRVPPQNVIRINWPGGNTTWSLAQFETFLLSPLTSTLADRALTDQIDYVVLSMDIPYKIVEPNGANSTTSVLFYGFKADEDAESDLPDSCSLPEATTNDYAGSEGLFRQTGPGTLSQHFLTTMITASNLHLAKRIVDQGVAGDETHPTEFVLLPKTHDVSRNVRFYSFDHAVFNARVFGRPSIARTTLSSLFGLSNLLGWQHGLHSFNISSSNTFVPGAMADNLTSFGGLLFVPNDQTTMLRFIDAGASGTYGTVVEPCAHLEKFPSPQNYFYQGRGFSLAECYYQSLTNPYQGLVLGEPLSAPFRHSAAGAWEGLPHGAVLSGTTNLSATFAASDSAHPLQRIDLFVDGRLAQTLTNISPRRFNSLNVSINGREMTYAVPDNASLHSVATGLAAVLNQPANLNQTGVRAYVHGDRIELQAIEPTSEGTAIPVTAGSTIGAASGLTTFIHTSRPAMLDSTAHGLRTWTVNAESVPNTLQMTVTTTNGQQVTITATNGGGSLAALVQQIVDGVNSTNALQGPDGVVAEDLVDQETQVEFNLRARSAGIRAAQVTAQLSSSGNGAVEPEDSLKLDQNLSALRPRNHLYITTGATNLPLTFAFDSTAHSDGWHELTLVAYEGTHVHTQTRLEKTVLIQNTSLTTTLNAWPGGSNAAIEATLEFEVTANTNSVATTELFSTGGSLGVVSGGAPARFSIPGSQLGPGLHPFHALVTTTDDRRYRTETVYLRLTEAEDPFPLTQSRVPLGVSWNAVGGRSYDVLSAERLGEPLQIRATVVPDAGGPFQWIDPSPAPEQRFYRVRMTP